jgi:hypothetical protein
VAWIFLVLGAVIVVAIAAAFVGSEAFRLGHEAPAAIFDVEEAVDAVADGLPADAQARLTYDEVHELILATLDHLHAKGVGALPGQDIVPTDDAVVIADDDALAVVLGVIEAHHLDVSDDDAALVVRGFLRHLDEIGALGPRA